MAEKIYFEGSGYISVKDAAKKFAFTPDYIGRLCRMGKIRGRRVAKNWYVEEVSLASFVKNETEAKTKRRQGLVEGYARSRSALEEAGEEKILTPAAAAPEATAIAPVTATAEPALWSAEASMRRAVATMPPRALPSATIDQKRGSEFLRKTAALTFALCATFGTSMLCSPSARALAMSVAQNSAAGARDVLHSDPRNTALALDRTFTGTTNALGTAVLALGNEEIGGIAQVGNAFSAYSNSFGGGIAQSAQPTFGPIVHPVFTALLGENSLFPSASLAAVQTAPTNTQNSNTPSIVYRPTTVVEQADLSPYVTQASLSQQFDALKSSFAQLIDGRLATTPPSPAGTAGGFGGVYTAGSATNNTTVVNSTSGATALSGLSDVSLSSPGSGQLFEYNGSSWTNVATSSLGFTGSSSQWTTSGSDLYYTGGGVGIGTTDMLAPLVVDSGGSDGSQFSTSTVFINDTGRQDYLSVNMKDNVVQLNAGSLSSEFGGFGTTDLTFATGYSAGAPIERMRITDGGLVGIGTTTPGSLLALGGIANFTAATSTFYSSGGINIEGGCFSVNGTCVGAGGGVGLGANTWTGLQTFNAGYVSQASSTVVGNFTATATSSFAGGIVGPNNFTVQQTSGLVGIGTASPYALLDLAGGSTGNAFEIDSTASAASTTVMTVSNAGLVSIGDDIGSSSGIFTVDASSSTTTISNLSVGNLTFDTDAGIVNLSDIPVDGNAAPGVQEAQVINIGGNPVFTASGISNGSGGVTNLYVGIGTTTNPYSTLEVWGPDAASSTPAFTVVNNASTTVFAVFDGGNAQLSGTLTQSSDERLKTNIQSLDASSSLSLINQLNPVTFNWIDTSQGTTPQVGFIAQQVQQVFPNLVSTTSPTALTPDGTLGVNYIGFIAPIISAIQEITKEIAQFAVSITTNLLTTQEVDTQKLCVGDVCVTQQQFLAMVAAAGQSSSGSASGAGSAGAAASGTSDVPPDDATTTAPQITVLGNNPATINVGASYNDLGTQIVGPQQDLNLGIQASVDGATSTPISGITIDTSVPGTHTIIYTATDQNGLVGQSSRTVDVIAPESDTSTSTPTTTSDVDTSDPDASSTPPTDDASSTEATSTQP